MNSTFKNLIANYIGRIWTSLLGFLLIPFYIKSLGVEGYGLIGFYLSLNAILSILDLGIGSAINRELAKLSLFPNSESKQRQLVKTLEYIYVGLAILITLVIFFTSNLILKYWIKIDINTVKSPIRIIQLMGIASTFQFPVSFYQGGLMGIQKQISVNKILIFTGTIKGIGSVLVLKYISADIESYFIWQIAAAFLTTVIFRYNLWKSLPKINNKLPFSFKALNEIWKFAATMSLNSVISLLMTQLDKIVLIKILSLKSFGYYSIATTAASTIWLIIIPFNNSIFPKLVQLYEKNDLIELKKMFHLFSNILSILLFPICAIFVFFSKNILFIWLKDVQIVENTYLLLSLLTIGTMLNGVPNVPGSCSIAFGWPMLVTKINAIQSIFLIPLILLLVKFYNAEGAAFSWILMNLTYIVFLVPRFFRKYLTSEKKKWFLQDTFYPFIISFVFCFTISYVLPFHESKLALILEIGFTWFINIILLLLYQGRLLNVISSCRNIIYNSLK